MAALLWLLPAQCLVNWTHGRKWLRVPLQPTAMRVDAILRITADIWARGSRWYAPAIPLTPVQQLRRAPPALLSDSCAIRRLGFFAKTKSTDEELTFGLADILKEHFFPVQECRGSSNRTNIAPPYWPHSEGGSSRHCKPPTCALSCCRRAAFLRWVDRALLVPAQ